MKPSHSILTIIGWLALVVVASDAYPVQSDQSPSDRPVGAAGNGASDGGKAPQARQSDAGKLQPDGWRRDATSVRGRVRITNHAFKAAIPAKPNRGAQNSAPRVVPSAANTVNTQRPHSVVFIATANAAFAERETSKSALPVRPPGVVQRATPSLGNLRHRGPNPPVIGGWANPNARNAGTVNGDRMGRKP